MESIEEFPASDPSKLSDLELIRRYCADRSDQEVADELWRRFGDTLHDSVKKAARWLKPGEMDHRSFVDACFTRAYINLFARICSFRFEGSIEGWLSRVAKTALLDERRALTRSRSKIAEESLEERRDSGLDEASTDDFSSNPDVSNRRRGGAKGHEDRFEAYQRMTRAERKTVVREILCLHASASDENAESARDIRLHHWRNWSKAEIARYRFGDTGSGKEQNTREAKVGRELRKDYDALRLLLKTRFGVSSLLEI
jgi:DNA-directed RNA polymerase specialized sigma24 family protein